MRSFLRLLLFINATTLCAADSTALAALKLIPKEKAANLARIEARDGTPNPDRWYLLVHDPDDENGLHEFVVASDEVVASRAVSQFAEKLGASDVIGSSALKIDSDQAAKIARQYAQANDVSVATINYELKREGDGAAPVWKIECLDEKGKSLGDVVITAGKGNVISHDGFAAAPHSEAEKKPERFDVYADPEVAKTEPAPIDSPTEDDEARRVRNENSRGNPVGNVFKSMGRGVRRLLPF